MIKTKQQHEQQLIAKSVRLLNEKKLQVRNQQRIIASAKIDPKLQKEMERPAAGGREAMASRRSKRKALEQQETSEESDAFEQMDVDRTIANTANRAAEQDSEERATPSATEDDDNAGLPLRTRSRSATPEGKEKEVKPVPQSSSPPPPREFSFAKVGSGKGKDPGDHEL